MLCAHPPPSPMEIGLPERAVGPDLAIGHRFGEPRPDRRQAEHRLRRGIGAHPCQVQRLAQRSAAGDAMPVESVAQPIDRGPRSIAALGPRAWLPDQVVGGDDQRIKAEADDVLPAQPVHVEVAVLRFVQREDGIGDGPRQRSWSASGAVGEGRQRRGRVGGAWESEKISTLGPRRVPPTKARVTSALECAWIPTRRSR